MMFVIIKWSNLSFSFMHVGHCVQQVDCWFHISFNSEFKWKTLENKYQGRQNYPNLSVIASFPRFFLNLLLLFYFLLLRYNCLRVSVASDDIFYYNVDYQNLSIYLKCFIIVADFVSTKVKY